MLLKYTINPTYLLCCFHSCPAKPTGKRHYSSIADKFSNNSIKIRMNGGAKWLYCLIYYDSTNIFLQKIYQSGPSQLHSRKNRPARRWGTIAGSCSHLNREGQGSGQQKCSEDQAPLELHGAARTEQCASPSPWPRQRCRRYSSGACSARAGSPAPANGNPSRKQTSFAASTAGLAPGHLLVLRYRRRREHP